MQFTRAMLIVALLAASGFAAEPITVRVASGRTFVGTLDPRSSNEKLVLTMSAGEAAIARPIAWERVVSVHSGAKEINVADLRREAAARATAPTLVKQNVIALSNAERIVAHKPVVGIDNPFADEPTPIVPGPVRSLRLDAYVANWTGTVESSGFVVHVTPLDARGLLVPVSGTLEVEWIGPRRRDFNELVQGHGVSLERLGYWSTSVHAEETAAGGIYYEAAFPSVHPEFTSTLRNYALVNVKLTVPGEGVFSASLDGIRLRPFSPVRNLQEINAGGRFFPSETTSRGIRYSRNQGE